MKPLKLLLLLITGLLILAPGCKQKAENEQLASAPEWAKEVIWYQIFVERFRNGDPENDPSPADLKGSYPGEIPADWSITPWGHDWYAHEPWLDSVKADDFKSKIQARRYGGDLQGVLDKLDYVQELGITAIYFNPLNDSPSLHKYDARNYTHIDRNFGPDPKGDVEIMNSESPDDPSTWKWTEADNLFLKVVNECHKRGIRVIMDYSWNHTGRVFWALNDIRKNGSNSAYKDWYNIIQYDDPATTADEFSYEGWGGNNTYMPVFRKDIIPPDDSVMPFEENLHSITLKQHIFDVSSRWLDPDKNGNPSDGVDGFRLDVAGEVPMGFWRDYRKEVRSVNPDYKINKPDELTRKEQMLLLVHQFTYIGAPHIWNGDEVGMWGADDPDCRKPVVWSDIVYEDERANYDPEKSRPVDVVKPDSALISFYKSLTRMRRENPVLVHGDLKYILADDQKMVLAYSRKMKDDQIIAVFNRSDKSQTIILTELKNMECDNILSSGGISLKNNDSGLELTMDPLSAVVLK